MPPNPSEENSWYSEELQPHEPMLKAWIRSRFSSELDVDDIVQEACMRVLKVSRDRE